MSNYVEQIVKETQEHPAETETRQAETSAQETAQPAEQSSPDESRQQSDESQNHAQSDSTDQEQTRPSTPSGDAQQPPSQDTPKTVKDYSSFSKEEKAQFAFGRQLAKQKQKYADSMESFKAEMKKEMDELKKSLKVEDKPKSRVDFQSDDEYIDYLAERKVNAIMGRRDEEAAKAAEEKAKKDAEAQSLQSVAEETAKTFNANVSEYFKGRDAEREAFSNKVNLASQNGLGELLDNAPSVKDFVFTMPDGVAVLNEMLNDRNTFIRVMQASVNPMVCTVEMMRIAQEARQRGFKAPQQQQMDLQNTQQQAQPQGMPHIGKPGARQGGGTSRPLNSDADIIDFLRAGR